jgi:hypothetical protein
MHILFKRGGCCRPCIVGILSAEFSDGDNRPFSLPERLSEGSKTGAVV